MENVGALVFVVLLLVAVVAGLIWLARSGEQSRLELEKEGARPAPKSESDEGPAGEAEPDGGAEDEDGAELPLREALVAGIEVPSLSDLPAAEQLRTWPREPRSWPLGSFATPLPLLASALEQLGAALPVSPVDDDFLFVPADRVEATGKALGQVIARANETVALLERLEREGRKEGDREPAEAGTIEQALKGGTELARLSPAVDAARLIHLLHARATAAGRPTGESLFVRIRASASYECLRRLTGEPPPAEARGVPRCAVPELQVLRGGLPSEEETPELVARAEAAFRAASSSAFFPSSRPVTLLLGAALQKAGLLFELKRSADSTEPVWVIPGDEVNGALHALEAAAADSRDPLLKKDAKEAFLAALAALEREREDARAAGRTSDPAALRAALDSGQLPAEPTPAIEVAAAVRTIMLVAREADRHKDALLLLPRRCQLSAE